MTHQFTRKSHIGAAPTNARLCTMNSLTEISNYILANDALFTLVNPQTANRVTFRIYLPEQNQTNTNRKNNMYWVTALHSDGSHHYLGKITRTSVGSQYDAHNWEFSTTKGTWNHWTEDSDQLKGFEFFFNRVMQQDYTEKDISPLVFQHVNSCSRCGRTLTDPESVIGGIGPVCRQQMGL